MINFLNAASRGFLYFDCQKIHVIYVEFYCLGFKFTQLYIPIRILVTVKNYVHGVRIKSSKLG